jgi:putative ABC transport system permease protein
MTLTGLAFRNVLRNRFRVILTVLGVAVAIFAFVFLRTFVWAWNAGAEAAAKDRIVTRHKVTFVMTLPRRYVEELKGDPALGSHLKAVTFANWFGGKDPAHDKEFFATLAGDDASFFDVYDEMAVPPDQMTAWKEDRKGVIVGDVLAKKLGWKVGDKVTLESPIYPEPSTWEFNIRGIYEAKSKSVDRSTFVFHWSYLNEAVPAARKDEIGWIVSRTDNPAAVADTSAAIDRLFDSKDTQTLSQDERSFQASFLAMVSALLKAMDIISVVILAIMMLILGNTIAMGVRERTNEYGVLRAMGFFPKHVAWFIMGEAMLVGLMGGLLGVLLAYPTINQGVGRWAEENLGSMIPYFRVQPQLVATALVLAILLAALAAVIPAYRASKLRVIDALRRVA